MPCSDGQPPPRGIPEHQVEELKRRLDRVTQLLCAVCRHHPDVPAEVWDWYEQHKKWDDERGDQ